MDVKTIWILVEGGILNNKLEDFWLDLIMEKIGMLMKILIWSLAVTSEVS